MPKIESIRPGGTLSASFAEYPLPDLLFGILRGNLSGRLDIMLHPEPRNRIYFRDGVPIAVDLADAQVSIIELLVTAGELSESMGKDLHDAAKAEGRGELTLLNSTEAIPAGRLRELEARRARAQLVRLFDVGTIDFVFYEGVDRPEQTKLTILQSLPIVYEGLRTTKDRAILERILEEHKGKTFELAATYPHGVDPFEWGDAIEQAIAARQDPFSLADLVEGGLDKREASAAVAALLLAGMLEEKERVAKPKSEPRAVPMVSVVPRQPLEPGMAEEPSGLVIHYKSGAKQKAGKEPVPPPPPAPPPPAVPPSPFQLEYDGVKAHFAHYEGKNYYQILRVVPNTEPAQIERAYRFLVRRPDGGEVDDGSSRALKGLYHEAFEALSDPERARRYRALVEWNDKSKNAAREREALEAEPKVDRGFRALGEGHLGEARALFEWAKKLDPLRGDVPLMLELVQYQINGNADPLGIATALVAERQLRPDDERVKMAYAFCLAEESENTAARSLLEELGDREHPMAKRVENKLRG